ncbi:tyrosine-type recombinase/integrase [Fusobacterium sp. MFO224]|uniref:tyrosine-type recombinase/integrase n=1 Tax=Fusobacterium sp. MFO224 TaxID=3378070 RepID=UPI003852FE50
MKLVNEFFFQLEKEEVVSKVSIDFYKKDILDFFEYLDGKSLLEVTEEDIMVYLEFLKSKYAENSIIRKITSLKSMYKYFIKKEYVSDSPIEKISTTRKNIKVGRKIKGYEIKAILDICGDSRKERRDSLIIKLLSETGLKISEILNLEAIDLKKNNYKSFTVNRGNEYIIIQISLDLSLELREYIEKMEIETGSEVDKIFHDITNQNFKDRFIKYGKKAKLEREVLPSMIRNKCMDERKKEMSGFKKENRLEEIRKEYFKIGIGDEN